MHLYFWIFCFTIIVFILGVFKVRPYFLLKKHIQHFAKEYRIITPKISFIKTFPLHIVSNQWSIKWTKTHLGRSTNFLVTFEWSDIRMTMIPSFQIMHRAFVKRKDSGIDLNPLENTPLFSDKPAIFFDKIQFAYHRLLGDYGFGILHFKQGKFHYMYSALPYEAEVWNHIKSLIDTIEAFQAANASAT